MFNFKELLKIFKINWKNIINETTPKDNKIKFSKSFIDNANTGIIINIISCILPALIYYNNITINLLRIGIMIALIILINNYKEKEINSTIVFVGFIIFALGMLGSALSCVFNLYRISYGVSNYLIHLLICGLETVSYAFMSIACIEFCKDARKKYDLEHQVKKNEEIKLTTIGVNDISMHAKSTCPYCNKEINDNDVFCSSCGKKIK